MTPDEFRKEYVEPAAEHWRQNLLVTHLAANAIAQVDALADVVWIAQGRPGRVSDFREDLGQREPAIAVVRDACDSHKHGALRRKSATHVSDERPSLTFRYGYVIGQSAIGSMPIHFTVLAIRKLDGTEQAVANILFEAMQAWRREFGRLGYGTDWSFFGSQI